MGRYPNKLEALLKEAGKDRDWLREEVRTRSGKPLHTPMHYALLKGQQRPQNATAQKFVDAFTKVLKRPLTTGDIYPTLASKPEPPRPGGQPKAQLTRVTLRNYKSLENLTVEMKPFMVFIGRNNTGKSNIFDCFQFLSDFVNGGREARKSLQEKGGFEQVVFNGDIGQTISMEVEGSLRVKGEERRYRYFIELEGDRHGNCFNKREFFSLVEDNGKVLLGFPSEQGYAIARDETGKQTGGIGASRDTSYLYQFRDLERYPILSHFSQDVQRWAFFNFLPPLMRSSLPVEKDYLLHALQTEYPQKFKEIEDILMSAVEELEEMTTALTPHQPGKTYIRIREKGLSIPIPAWRMSGGTLRLLGHLATLYLPSPPPLICFEEPENYIHPRLIQLIVDLLKNASDKAQVLVTTYSPYFVDRLQPEDLFIVEKQNGKTQVKKAEDKKGIKQALQTLGLGEMWYSGSLGDDL